MGVGKKVKPDSWRSGRVRFSHQLPDQFLVAAVHPIESANRKPGSRNSYRVEGIKEFGQGCYR